MVLAGKKVSFSPCKFDGITGKKEWGKRWIFSASVGILKKTERGEETASIQGEKQQIEFLMEQLSSFQNLFDTLSVPEKREYLRMIIDKVVWDGEQAHIFIYGSH